jgi:uncharacterized protein YbaA (DUF1428 family)
MTFVDITAAPVSADHKRAYIHFSRRMAEVYRDHGATRVTGYWQVSVPTDQNDLHADGLTYDEGDLRDFPAVLGATTSEAIIVTVTEWPSREARDSGTAAATSDPRVLATVDEDPVFDGRRVVANCFETTMDLGT